MNELKYVNLNTEVNQCLLCPPLDYAHLDRLVDTASLMTFKGGIFWTLAQFPAN